MGLDYRNLDDNTRRQAEAELDFDINRGALYLSQRLTESGVAAYPDMLRDALRRGSDATLAEALRQPGILATHEMSHRLGRPYRKRVPVNAADTLAEGEFNRFYLRGLCRRALDEGINALVVYRAKDAAFPRPESEALIGKHLEPATLLEDLRASGGADTALGLPPGPNSGLSACLP